MQYSVVNFSEVHNSSKDLLLHAEFYKPEILKFRHKAQKNGYRFLSEYAGYLKRGTQPEYNEFGTIKVLRSVNIRENGFSDDRQEYVSEEFYNSKNKGKTKYNDVLLNSTGVGTLGRCAIIKTKEKYFVDGHITIINQLHDITPEFLYVYLNSKYAQSQIDVLYKGSSGQIEIYPEDIKQILIKPLNIQDKISEMVNKAFELKEQAKTQYAQAEYLLITELGLKNWKPQHQLSYIRNFLDTKSAERIDAEYFQPKYEEIVEYIKQQKHSPLSELINYAKKCIEPGSVEYTERGVPFIRVCNLSKYGLTDNNQQYISQEYYDKNIMHQPQKDEILLSKDGSIGIAYHLSDEPKKMICSGGIVRLSAKENIRPEYLTLVLNSFITANQSERDSGGALISHWLIGQIEKTLIPILDNQNEIADLVQASYAARTRSEYLLKIAKQAVEKAIEENEGVALEFINNQI